jgi:hypothetical protein
MMAIDQWLGILAMPVLFILLHAVGLVLSLAYWRRCPAACSLLFTACILNLLGTGGRLAATLLLQQGMLFTRELIWGLAFLNWLGGGLMLMAIFAGRNEPTRLPPRSPRWPPDDDKPDVAPPTPPMASSKDSTGIQVK